MIAIILIDTKRLQPLKMISHRPVKQGELVYIESKTHHRGVWCQKLPVNKSDGRTETTCYIPLEKNRLLDKIVYTDVYRPDCNLVVTKVIRSGENVVDFIMNGMNPNSSYIENLIPDVSKFDKYYDHENECYPMYRVKEYARKRKITCKSCTRNGCVYDKCNECGGKGIRNKTFKRFEIDGRMYDCGKIGFDKKSKRHEFYDKHDSFSFFYESTRVFFNKEDAIARCEALNIENGYIDKEES